MKIIRKLTYTYRQVFICHFLHLNSQKQSVMTYVINKNFQVYKNNIQTNIITDDNTNNKRICITYIKGISEQIANTLNHHHIEMCFKTLVKTDLSHVIIHETIQFYVLIFFKRFISKNNFKKQLAFIPIRTRTNQNKFYILKFCYLRAMITLVRKKHP